MHVRRTVALGGQHEVDGDDVGPLVQQLEEGMLAVGPSVAEDGDGGGAGSACALPGHPLAVRLHLQLLQEGGEQGEPAGVGNHRADGASEAVAVPDLRQGHQHRGVGLQGC